MVGKVDTAVVKLWDEIVGAVSWLDDKAYSVFEYAPSFLKKGLEGNHKKRGGGVKAILTMSK